MIPVKVVMDKFWTECKYIMKARSQIDKTKKKTGTNHLLFAMLSGFLETVLK